MIYTIDNLGNLYNQDGIAVGTYDSITKVCELYNGTAVNCPIIDPKKVDQGTVKGAATYWWIVLVLFILFVLLLAWWINK